MATVRQVVTDQLRVLDPALAVNGLINFAAPLEEIASLRMDPRTTIIFENKESLLSMPALPGTVAIFGSGYAVGVLDAIIWLANTRLLYWGDLDSHGLANLNQIRSHLPTITSILRDEDTLSGSRAL